MLHQFASGRCSVNKIQGVAALDFCKCISPRQAPALLNAKTARGTLPGLACCSHVSGTYASEFTMESVITIGMPPTLSGTVGTPVGLVTLVRLRRSCSRVRRFMKQ